MKLEFPGGPEVRPIANEEARTRRALLHMLEDLQRDRAVIQRARQKWTDTVDAIADPLMVHDVDFRIVRANKAYARLAGIAIGDLPGRLYWECFPHRRGPLPGCARAVAHVAAGRPRAHHEAFTLDDGRIFESRVFEQPNPETGRIDSLHLFQDVTDKHQTAERLQLANLVIENSPSVLLRCAAEPGWPITYASDNVTAWGFDAATLVATKTAFGSLVHADDVDKLRAAVDVSTRQHVDRFSADFRIVDGNGAPRWVEGRCFIERNAQGEPAYYQGIVTDITDRKEAELALAESERRLGVIFDGASDGLLVADPETQRIVLGNPTMARMLGCARTELATLAIADMLPLDRPDLLADFGRHASGEKTFSANIPLRRQDGSMFDADISSALLTMDGRAQLLGIFRDVSERQRADAKIRELARFPQENPNGVMRIADDGRVSYANAASAQLLRACADAAGTRVDGRLLRMVDESLADGAIREVEIPAGDRTYSVVITPFGANG
jgi:PAS domain S-box-containing protein